jgi:hypothetical protein
VVEPGTAVPEEQDDGHRSAPDSSVDDQVIDEGAPTLAEGPRMTAGALVAKTLLDAHADVLREALRVVLAQRMEAESRAKTGAAHGEVSDSRLTQRTG